MKTLITLFSIFLISFSGTTINEPSAELVQDQLVFDGYEGNYYFFSDENYQAVVLEVSNKETLKNYDLINGNLEGKVFKVAYTATENPENSSAIGIIQYIKPLP
ncbi:hypothetical protein [Leeuwenhoekiella sp. MAR_2009_132]|uniref:hypothetical protein n=1 Tax=Leeuwenhoekiella sp. MAR_2009_132 TaxID=1392489 RepID=UPI00048AF8C2|nr:hypothetical protein [Leeuwenhoekiella sp. MAR_2009_132]